MTLIDFVNTYTARGECQCGKCIDKGTTPDPIGHTVDTGFFKVAVRGVPEKEVFERLVRAHEGEYGAVDMFEGVNNYVTVGAWIGDQGLGMQCMALGHLLGCWELIAKEGYGCLTVPAERFVSKTDA